MPIVDTVIQTFAGKKLLDPAALYDFAARYGLPTGHWFGRANSFHLTLGKRPGYGWVLVSQRDLLTIDENAGQSLVFRAGSDTATLTGLFIVSANAVYPDLASTVVGPATAYILELADKRRLFGMSHANKSYNVRCASPTAVLGAGNVYVAGQCHTDSLSGGTTLWTWQTMLDNLWAALPSGASPGTSPTLPVTPDGTPEEWRFVGQSAWDAYNAVLAKLEMAIRYNPISGACSLVRLDTLQAELNPAFDALENRLLDQTALLTCYAGNMPEKIRVHFPVARKHIGSERETDRGAANESLNPVYTVDHSTGVSGVKTGTILNVYDDMPAIFVASGGLTSAPSNSTAINARAAEVGARTAGRLDNSEHPFRHQYTGVVTSIMPGSGVYEVVWSDYGFGGLRTTWLRPGESIAAQNGGSAGGGGNLGGVWSVNSPAKRPIESAVGGGMGAGYFSYPSSPARGGDENLIRPNHARRSPLLYPGRLQLIEIDGTGSAGDSQARNASGLWKGLVKPFDADQTLTGSGVYVAGEACWIHVHNRLLGSSDSGATLLKGDRYLGRLVGHADVSSDVRPLYTITRHEGEFTPAYGGLGLQASWTYTPTSLTKIDFDNALDSLNTTPDSVTNNDLTLNLAGQYAVQFYADFATASTTSGTARGSLVNFALHVNGADFGTPNARISAHAVSIADLGVRVCVAITTEDGFANGDVITAKVSHAGADNITFSRAMLSVFKIN